MEHLWNLASVVVGALLGYMLTGTTRWFERRRNVYDDTTRFLADYRVRAMGCQTPQELLTHAEWLNRQISDEFPKRVFDEWRKVHSFLQVPGLPSQSATAFDDARDRALDAMQMCLRWCKHF